MTSSVESHAPINYKGSRNPAKFMLDLQWNLAYWVSLKEGWTEKLSSNPRPAKYRSFDSRSANNNNVRNLSLNYMLWPQITLLQTYAPANLKAIDLDHNYFTMMSSDHYCKTSRINEITSDEITAIKLASQAQGMPKVWKAERSKRITASNFGKVCKSTELNKLARQQSWGPIQ